MPSARAKFEAEMFRQFRELIPHAVSQAKEGKPALLRLLARAIRKPRGLQPQNPTDDQAAAIWPQWWEEQERIIRGDPPDTGVQKPIDTAPKKQ